MSGHVPLRRSLLVRLLAASIVIAACSIAATAWLVMQGTTKAIQQEQGQDRPDDAHIYDALVGYGAAHPSWDGVATLVHDLSLSTGHQITLATSDRLAIAGPAPTGATFTVVDPLHVDPALLPAAPNAIDNRAVGPYLLPTADRQPQRAQAESYQSCLKSHGFAAAEVEAPSGHVSITSNAPQQMHEKCQDTFPYLVPRELSALTELGRLINACLAHDGVGGSEPRQVRFTDPELWAYHTGSSHPASQRIQDCLAEARRAQLRPYVAPAALLYVRSPGASSTIHTGFTLSAGNLGRVAGVAALVLLFTIAVTIVVGVRLVRPLRALTAAAHHPDGRHARVRVTGRDEIGALAAVLNDMAERRARAEEQRRAMVSDIAHELRTPLANIRSWLEAVEDGIATVTSDPELTSALLSEALQLQHIVNDLQDLAAADAGTLRLDRQPVQIRDLVRRAATAHRGGAEASGVRIDEDAEDMPDAVVDPVRLTQALGNLIANAVRYTPADGVVTVRACVERQEVVVSVSDTGPGIAPDDLPRVFDRFWRADRSRTRDTGGSGLGLAIVRQIIEAHHGTVAATSVPGHGATFTVRLPLVPRP